ncbi:MAG: PAS domain S-box protein, partial [Bacteroidetes bacterium]
SAKKFQEFGGYYFKHGYFKEGIIELDWKHKNGNLVTVEHNLTNLYKNGKINGFQAIGRDITEIKRTQEENKLLALVAKYTDNLVVITDKKGYIQWVNDTFIKISGYKLEEVLDKRPGTLLQGKDSDPSAIRYMAEKIRERKGFSVELLNYSKFGRKYWVNIDCQPVFDEENKLIHFIAVQTEVSRRKRLENKLVKFYQESKSFRAALEKSAIIVVLNKDKKIKQVNQAFCQMTGYTATELLDKDIALFDFELEGKFAQYIWSIVDKNVFWRSEVHNYAKDQSIYWIDRTINPIQDSKGEISQYMLVSHDISARKFAEKLNKEQAEKLKSKLEHEVDQRTRELKEEKDKAHFITKQIRSSIFYAKRIQTAILPSEAEMKQHLSDFFIYNLPKDIVSGDFYWFGIKDDKTIVSVIDCTGHGVPGAFMSMIAYSLMNEIVHRQGILSPVQILELLDENVKISLRQKDSQVQDGMDMALCVIDKNTNILTFAGAKNPMIYIENGELKLLKGSRKHIGGRYNSKSTFEQTKINIQPNSIFYMFSDGYIDQFGGEQKRKFSRERMQNLFLEIYQKSMLEQMDILDQQFIAWMGGFGTRLDDVLVLGFKI